jgi:hypothetical protein
MAVAYSAHTTVTPLTNSTVTSGSWAIAGTNLVIVIVVTLESATVTVTGVSWSLGSGTAYQVATALSTLFGAAGARTSVWAIPAPTAGTGTYTVNVSGSVPLQLDALLFTGADQTTPCPIGDAATTTGSIVVGPTTVTPTNLGATDATAGGAANTYAGSPNGITPNSTYLDSSSNVNIQAGYATGTTGLSAGYDSTVDGNFSMVAVRVQMPVAVILSSKARFPKFRLRGGARP